MGGRTRLGPYFADSVGAAEQRSWYGQSQIMEHPKNAPTTFLASWFKTVTCRGAIHSTGVVCFFLLRHMLNYARPFAGATVCGVGGEGTTLTLTCENSGIFTSIDFAAFVHPDAVLVAPLRFSYRSPTLVTGTKMLLRLDISRHSCA
jgi:hypothetical protein